MNIDKIRGSAECYLRNHVGPSFMSADARIEGAHELAMRVPDLLAVLDGAGEAAERQGVALAEAHKMIADRDNEIARLTHAIQKAASDFATAQRRDHLFITGIADNLREALES